MLAGLLAAPGFAGEILGGSMSSGALPRDPFKSWLPKKEIPAPVAEKTEETQAPQPVPQAKIEPVQLPAIEVSGIVWNTKRPQAIINETVVNIGDTIDNIKIVDIHQDGVDVIYKEIMFTIPINAISTHST